MRVRRIDGEKGASGFDGGVDCLHTDLCCGQVPPHDHVQVFDLGEGSRHGGALLGKG